MGTEVRTYEAARRDGVSPPIAPNDKDVVEEPGDAERIADRERR